MGSHVITHHRTVRRPPSVLGGNSMPLKQEGSDENANKPSATSRRVVQPASLPGGGLAGFVCGNKLSLPQRCVCVGGFINNVKCLCCRE